MYPHTDMSVSEQDDAVHHQQLEKENHVGVVVEQDKVVSPRADNNRQQHNDVSNQEDSGDAAKHAVLDETTAETTPVGSTLMDTNRTRHEEQETVEQAEEGDDKVEDNDKVDDQQKNVAVVNPKRPVKRARTGYFIFADEKRPEIQNKVKGSACQQ
jgi:hypothetical protein